MSDTLAAIVETIQRGVAGWTPNDEEVRLGLLHSAHQLVAALETPAERATKVYPYLILHSMSQLLIDTGVYKALSKANGPRTASQLAEDTSVDPALVERILKYVAVENHIDEKGPDEYAPNETTHLLAGDGAGAIMDTYSLFPLGANMPEYFKQRGYRNPTSKEESLCYYIYKMHYFDWINQPGNEDKIEYFKAHMRLKTTSAPWHSDAELVKSVLGGGKLSENDVLLVDVGGNDGHDLRNFHKAHPELSGRLILQDLEQLISSVDTDTLTKEGVEAMAHDMFKPQPIKEAKAYYLKMVLHDWPDEDCQKALVNLRDAMKPGYSRILLNEIVIPAVGAGKFETSLDMLMMMVHAAKERREQQWWALIEGVEGLHVKKIWVVKGAVESGIEIERVK